MAWEIKIALDSMTASLDLKKFEPDETISFEEIAAALQEKKVQLDSQAEEKVRDVVSLIGNGEYTGQMALVEGCAAVHGKAGYFEWSEKCDPDRQGVAEDDVPSGRASFYERSSLIVVDEGEEIGKLHPATTGEDGKDVFGQSLSAKPGENAKMQAGKNVALQDDGMSFIAQCAGELKLEGQTLSIDPVLTIKSNVDFATGNINYSGDVVVRGDVKDLFEVEVGGDLTIEGTVEAATVQCGGSLTVKRGVTGKEKGNLKVQKDLTSKYLSNVTVWVEGDVQVDSEIVNTNLNCRGKVILQRGAVHGGQVTAAGNIEAPVIGSPAGVRTIIRAALDPFLDRQLQELKKSREELAQKIAVLMPKAKALLNACGGRPNADLQKLAQEIRLHNDQMSELDAKRQQLNQELAKTSNGTVTAHKIIYPGVVIRIGTLMQIVEHEMTGPVEAAIQQLEGEPATLTFRAPTQAAEPAAS